ncbi:auxin-responsive protein SAUR71 [Amborella trichopoda]|uniref:auxin-responsive protein SAUR71 n=1 Tax=Amborella trichopoda TaxID=13333 RepID=UPI0005D37FDF|nr:auxin-responsive protein SAUR71 [Amborella trichopoda]|eukprot:XP_011626038.1 auxin-responsive protein SAUR71 [Amborella trichopoda]
MYYSWAIYTYTIYKTSHEELIAVRLFINQPQANMGERNKCSMCRIVKLRQMARLWRKVAGSQTRAREVPDDVPAGHLAVRVGTSCRRFVIRATYLNHPVFRELLEQAVEEFGHEHEGPLVLPCDEAFFEKVVQSLSKGGSDWMSLSNCSAQVVGKSHEGLGTWRRECRPLLQGFGGRGTW